MSRPPSFSSPVRIGEHKARISKKETRKHVAKRKNNCTKHLVICRPRNDPILFEQLDHFKHCLPDRPVDCLEREVGVVWRLVGLVDAREPLDLAGPGLLVEPLHVPLLALCQRSVDVDLEEGQVGLFVQSTGHVPILGWD